MNAMFSFVQTLKWKALIALGILLVLSLLLSYSIVYFLVFPRFVLIEEYEAKVDVERVFLAIDQEVSTLKTLSYDWSAWDDTYQFVSDRNQDYIKSNLVPLTFIDAQLSLIGYLDQEGQPVWGQVWNLEEERLVPPEALPGGWVSLVAKSPLPQNPDDGIGGLLATPLGILMIAATPIVTSENEGPMRGTLFMGRLVSEPFLSALSNRVRLPLTVSPVEADSKTGSLPAHEGAAIGTLKAPAFDAVSNELLRVGAAYPAIDGTPLLNIWTTVNRHIHTAGRQAAQSAYLAFLFAGCCLLAGVWLIVRNGIITPLEEIGRVARHVGETGDLSRRLGMTRRDEIGTLASAFDIMSDRLDEARQQIASQAFKEGMAELASGVVHTIRNALTPLTFRLDRIRTSLDGLRAVVADQSQVVAALSRVETDVGRREKLREYFRLLEKDAEMHQQAVVASLDVVHGQMTNIEALLSRQESLRYDEAITVDNVLIATSIERALGALRARYAQNILVEIAPDVKALPAIRYSPMGLELIFTNILENAFESLKSLGGKSRIEILGTTERDGILERQVAHIKIRDNGEGIDPRNLDKLFQLGFTTRDHLGRGYGLHWCANMIQTMGGRIAVDSKGLNQGAEISVILPVV